MENEIYRECWLVEGTEEDLIALEEHIHETDVKHRIKMELMDTNQSMEEVTIRVGKKTFL